MVQSRTKVTGEAEDNGAREVTTWTGNPGEMTDRTAPTWQPWPAGLQGQVTESNGREKRTPSPTTQQKALWN